MKRPTDEQLLQIVKKFRLEDSSSEDDLHFEKQIGDFVFKIWCEVIDDGDLYFYETTITYKNEYDLESGDSFDEFNSFENFIEELLNSAKEKIKLYNKIIMKLQDIQDFISSENLDLEVVKELALNEIEGWP